PYTIGQADVDAGHVSNMATVSATDPSGVSRTSAPSSTNTPVDQTSTVTVVKSAGVTDVDGDGVNDLGDRILWSFLVTNTGTTSLSGVAVDDPTAGSVTCPVTSLPVGGSTTCTARTAHVISQSDVDAG